ncbi:hypothetical protein ACFQVC_28865 [Streptomyces monticola]|uniref:Peptidase inhibitor family I36 protein n=1 Tax=Streptomyces monticola TaxID=2666263 RepID=A0ABW2JPW8_9ACTN
MRTGKRWAAITGLATMAASAGLLLGTSPASADINCKSGYHCVFYAGLYDSARHSYFNNDTDFRNDTFNELTGRYGAGQTVHNNTWSFSNSSTSGYESHYYTGIGSDWGGHLLCVEPGSEVNSVHPDLRNRASSLRLMKNSGNCY